MKSLAAATMLLLLPAAAWAGSAESGTPLTSQSQEAPSRIEFIRAAAMSDMFEIQAGQLAIHRGGAKVADFARRMVADHGRMADAMKRMVSARGAVGRMPGQLDDAHRQRYDELQNAPSKSFDRQYAAGQVQAHQEAIALFERYAKDGGDRELKNWATQNLPTLQHHLDMAKALAR